MRRALFLILIFSAFFSMMGCAPKQIYYYGDYSKTLYHLEKNHNDDCLNKHKQELEKIISESETKKMPIPPGIYAELGFWNMKANNSKEAIKLFNEESNLYPESKLLMDRLIMNAQAMEKNENKTPDNISSAGDSPDSEKAMKIQGMENHESAQP